MMKKYGEDDPEFYFLTQIFMQNIFLKSGENAVKNMTEISAKISDEKLYELCQSYGERARMWRQKFAGLLPEVFKRELHKKKGFGSIYEFAAKLAGMSEEQVRRVLNLEKKFETTPILKQMLLNGEVSANKLAKIASIATPENEELLANQVKLLPCRALETLARDVHVNTNLQEKSQNASGGDNGLFNGLNGHGRLKISQELNLSAEVEQKLLELQQKGIDVNTVLLEFLEKRELAIAQKKEKLSAEAKPTESRHILAEVHDLLEEEHGEKCSIKTCARPATIIHHEQRFALSKIHDPKYLAPLCKEHHQIAHSIDVKYQEKAAR